MTKKDYIAMADALRPLYSAAGEAKNCLCDEHHVGRLRGVVEACNCVADVFAADNPRFNRYRWFSYLRGECGPNGGAIKTK